MIDEYEVLMQEESPIYTNIQNITCSEETFWKFTKARGSQHTSFFSDIKLERGGRREVFEVCGRLGKGASCIVFKAKKKPTGDHSSSEEVVALKVVPNAKVSKVEKEVLFRASGHPFLVQLLTYFQAKKCLLYMLEYMEGGTLRSLLLRHKRFSVDKTRFYAAEIILAVRFLHRCGIVHRDIKPRNILLDKDGHCKLADFGESEVGIFTRSKITGECGTKLYMAPEIRKGKQYGPEVDWWSVGCVIYEMLMGKRPNSFDNVHRKRFRTDLMPSAVCIVKNFLDPNPRRRLGARGDTLSILRHPFFKNVNWLAVLDKRVKPLTLDLLYIDPDTPGDGDDHSNQEVPIVLEATLHQDAPHVPQGHLEDGKAAEELLEEKNEEESVKEIVQELAEELKEEKIISTDWCGRKCPRNPSQIELLEAETMSNQGVYYRDILCVEICLLFCALAVFSVGYIYELF